MSRILTGILEFVLGLLLPAPAREPIPIRIDRRRRRP